MTPSIRLVAALVVGCVVASVSARAQGQSDAAARDAAKTRLDVTASVVEGYDSDAPANLLSTVDPATLQPFGGFTTIANGALAFTWRGGAHTQVGANAASTVRHYDEFGETRSLGHSAGVGVSTELPGRIALFANQSAAYSPTYLFNLFPSGTPVAVGDPGTTAPDYAVNSVESYTYTSRATLGRSIGRRSTLSVEGDFEYTDRIGQTELWKDLSAHSLRGRYSRNVSRNTVLLGEYRFRSGDFGYVNESQTIEHGVDFGVAYTRPLSASRRMFVRVNIGASRADFTAQAIAGSTIVRRYLAVADAGFDYQINRTWAIRANYRRGLERVVDIPEPVFADSFSAGLGGLLGRRIDVSVSGGFSSGESVLNRTSLVYDTYTGDVRVSHVINHILTPFAEYLYYYYDFGGSTELRAGIPPGLERNGVRLGLTVRMPVLRR